MTHFARRVISGGVAAMMLAGVALSAQTVTAETQKPFEPRVSQPGKDVVWVPTPQSTVDAMLNLAKLTKDDFLVDLGSGDGIIVITAAKRGARAMGVEFNPDMVAFAEGRAKEAGVFFFSSRRRHTIFDCDWSSDVCSSD